MQATTEKKQKESFSIDAENREEQILLQCSRIQDALEQARAEANMYPESILNYLVETVEKTAETVCTLLVHITDVDRKRAIQGIGGAK